MEKYLFVPLTRNSFDDFRLMGKRWEVRRAERQWNKNQLRRGRGVTLSLGFGKKSRMRGKIGMAIFGSLGEIFKQVGFREIEPRAWNNKVAIRMNRELLGKAKEYVAFEVIL